MSVESGPAAPVTFSTWMPLWDDPMLPEDAESRALREKIAMIAGESVGKKPVVVNGVTFRRDCSGTVRGIYAKAGFPIGNLDVIAGEGGDTRSIFEIVRKRGSLRRTNPLVGDMVFFSNTYDKNRNGKVDDPLTHIGIVEEIESDGTVVIVHHIGRSIVRYHMNLEHPHQRVDDDGHVLNHDLSVRRRGTPGMTTGELFVAYGTLVQGQAAQFIAER